MAYPGGVALPAAPQRVWWHARAKPRWQRRRAATRGTVKGFSRRSARRLRVDLAKIRIDLIGPPMMVTLTFPERWPEGTGEAQRYWQRMWKAMRRRGFSFDRWRVEEQRRGAPHFHVLVWGAPESMTRDQVEAQLSALWFGILGAEGWGSTERARRRRGVTVTDGREIRKAYGYVAKYVNKAARDETYQGRRWGGCKDIPQHPTATYELEVPVEVAYRRMVRRWLKAKRTPGTRWVAKAIASGSAMTFVLIDQAMDAALFRAAMVCAPP